MAITYRSDVVPDVEQIIDVYRRANLDRPVSDTVRIKKIYENSNLVVTAWEGDTLVGISRSLTDFAFACYLVDLAVREEYKRQGIGTALIALTRERIGEHSNVLLLAAPEAIEYYPKVGFEKVENGFLIKRVPWT